MKKFAYQFASVVFVALVLAAATATRGAILASRLVAKGARRAEKELTSALTDGRKRAKNVNKYLKSLSK